MRSEAFSCHYGSTGGKSAAGFFTDPVSLIVGTQILKAYESKNSSDPKPGASGIAPQARAARYRAIAPMGSGS